MTESIRSRLKKDEKTILELYKNGLVAKEISEKLGYKYHQPIYNLLKRNGVFIPKNLNEFNYFKKYSVDEKYFDNIYSEAKAYILGFIAADGYVVHNRFIISINSQDKNILEKIKYEINSTHLIVDFIKDDKYLHSKLSINSVKLCSKLAEYGLLSPKSLTMKNIIKYIPKDLVFHFMRGYFDGDGCIHYGEYSTGKKYAITIIGTKKFLETSFNEYFQTNNKIGKYKSCNMYYWRISNKTYIKDFIEKIYENATIFLDRKYNYCAHLKLL
jgi:mobile intron protein|nr:MAG TPA: endonuclease [Caudoviricetes sp.]